MEKNVPSAVIVNFNCRLFVYRLSICKLSNTPQNYKISVLIFLNLKFRFCDVALALFLGTRSFSEDLAAM